MRVLEPGHRYLLDNLKDDGQTVLQFYQDPAIHGTGAQGPSTQEVLRAVIDRIQHLDGEKPWPLNALLVQKGREMIALFEMRALYHKVVKGELDIESLPVGADGHIIVETISR
jgi:hypothetical protein